MYTCMYMGQVDGCVTGALIIYNAQITIVSLVTELPLSA